MEIETTLLFIVGGIITIVLAPILAFFGCCVAEAKGRCRALWFILCGLFFPMLILLCVIPAKKSQESFSEGFLSVIRDFAAIPLQQTRLVILRIPTI